MPNVNISETPSQCPQLGQVQLELERSDLRRLRCHSTRWWAGINDGQTMDNSWINASSREFTVSSIGCAYRAELILGR